MSKKNCPFCGIDYAFISQKHRLGCSFCYFSFRKEMYYVFSAQQDNQFIHKGKIPKRYTDPVKMYVNQLINTKIENEDEKNDLKEMLNKKNKEGEKK